ncbi:MAG: hypothetical protein ACRD8O_22950 [Bryobacteraceae bacterium]
MKQASLTLFLLVTSVARAQQTVAPTTAPVGPPRGEDVRGYNVVNSFETGYRFSGINGDLGKYRSDVNFRNGIRLLGSSLTVHSKEGHGGLFDEIVLNTQGLGNDPYQASVFRIQKNKLYRYDMLWRRNEYYNPGLRIADGGHLLDTRRRLQDHEVTFLPQSKIQFRVGYTRNSQDGPALSTVQLFDARGDEFTPFADVRRLRNEFRAGGDLEFAGFKLNWLRAWDNFKEDTSYLLGSSPGANSGDRTGITGFRRGEPYHGNSPLWRGNLRKEARNWAANARIAYAGGRRNFTLDESAIGADRFGAARNRQILVTGNATRPVTAGDFSLSLFPGTRLTLVNNTSVHSTRIDGDSVYREINNATAGDNIIYFNFLGIRTITNSTDLNFRAASWLGLYSGYHYSTRRIRSSEGFDIPPFGGDITRAEQTNKTHSGLLGLRFKPTKPLTISLDGEIARADRPFTPISDRNHHNIGARVQYKTGARSRSLLLSAAYRQNYNTNSVAFSTHSARGRNYTFDAAWTPSGRFALDASYARLHLDTVSGVAFFGGGRVVAQQSIYVSNIHSANLGFRVALSRLVEFYAGYSVNRDTGDGRSSPAPPGAADPAVLLLNPVQTFPLNFQSPLARVSVRLHQRVRWNAGYQFYNYKEEFPLTTPIQNYRAHTGFTSLLWSF